MDMHRELKERFRSHSSPLECIPTGESPMLKPLDGIRAVVFDVYGTLIISGVGDIGVDDGVIAPERITEALTQSGIQLLPKGVQGKATSAGDSIPDGVEPSIHGLRALELYNETVNTLCQDAIASGTDVPEPDIRTVWSRVLKSLMSEGLIRIDDLKKSAERMSVEFEIRMNPTWPMPNIPRVLDHLRDRSLELGIISNSQFYTPIMMEAYAGRTLSDLGFSTDLLHWSFEEGLKKPSLQFYERFLDKMEKRHQQEAMPHSLLEPARILYVGNDMKKDILPAHTLGCKTALFAGDQRSLKWRREDPDCQTLQPDLVITDLMQIVSCLTS